MGVRAAQKVARLRHCERPRSGARSNPEETPRFDGEAEAWIATPSATARNDGVFNLSLGLPRGLQLLAMTREMIGPHALYEVTGQQALRFL